MGQTWRHCTGLAAACPTPGRQCPPEKKELTRANEWLFITDGKVMQNT
jgi:hypothetical protein